MKGSVVITGGNRGIGLDITRSFVEVGYHVVVGARNESGLNELFGDNITFIETDVKNEESHNKLAEAAISKSGKLAAYINNAGYSEWRPITEIDDEYLGDIIQTNLFSAFWGCKSAAKTMSEGSSIINISSIAGKRGSANNSAYCASKFGMNGLTQSLSKELGPRGIRVNAVCPVLIPTAGLMVALNSRYSPASSDPESFIAKFKEANSALDRLPDGDDVASTCLFLVSRDASAITGQCINVDCGVFPQ